MVLIVSVETLLLVVLLVLVAGLLRSHAEILRRLEEATSGGASGAGAGVGEIPEAAAPARAPGSPAAGRGRADAGR